MESYMNLTDIITGALLLLGMIGGIKRGLSGELLRIIMIGLSIGGGWTFASTAATRLSEYIDLPAGQLMTLSFFGLIVAAYVAMLIIRLGLRFLIDFSFKGKLEVIGGALIGLARAALMCSAIIMGLLMTKAESITGAINQSNAGSLVVKYVQPHYDELVAKNPEFNFPESPEAAAEAVEMPEASEYLGPITDEESTGGE